MQKVEKEQSVLVTPIVIVRKPIEDESLQYDRVCPKCGRQGMIVKWSWKSHSYGSARCQDLKCKQGNSNLAGPALPPLDFEV